MTVGPIIVGEVFRKPHCQAHAFMVQNKMTLHLVSQQICADAVFGFTERFFSPSFLPELSRWELEIRLRCKTQY